MSISLGALLEAIAWLAVACGYIRYVFTRPTVPHEDFEGLLLLMFSPFVLASCLSMAIGTLMNKRRYALAVAGVIIATPLILLFIFATFRP